MRLEEQGRLLDIKNENLGNLERKLTKFLYKSGISYPTYFPIFIVNTTSCASGVVSINGINLNPG